MKKSPTKTPQRIFLPRPKMVRNTLNTELAQAITQGAEDIKTDRFIEFGSIEELHAKLNLKTTSKAD